jgi:transposase
MKLHGSAALTVRQRRRMVFRVLDQGWTQKAAAAAEQVSQRTCSKWVARYRSEGESGLRDRSSAPRSRPRRTSARRVQAICALRRLRLSGPEIAELLAMPASTTSAILKREGLGRLGRIGLKPAERYERSRPGELVHVDIKSSGASRVAPASASRAGSRATRARGGAISTAWTAV